MQDSKWRKKIEKENSEESKKFPRRTRAAAYSLQLIMQWNGKKGKHAEDENKNNRAGMAKLKMTNTNRDRHREKK